MKRSMWIPLAMVAACGAWADVTTVNSAVIQPRFFNDIPSSTFTSTNNFPASVMLRDQNVGGETGWANRHVFWTSADGATPFGSEGGDDTFEYTFTGKLETAAISPRTEAGPHFLVPIVLGWWNDTKMYITSDGEVACDGAPVPYYNFTINQGAVYTVGTEVKMGARYFKDPVDNLYKWIWFFGDLQSPALQLEHLSNSSEGWDYDFSVIGLHTVDWNSEHRQVRIGGYIQVQRPQTDSKFTASNIKLNPFPYVEIPLTLTETGNNGVGDAVTIEVHNGTSVVQTVNTWQRPDGTVAFKPSVAAGTYKIRVKGATHLAKIINNVNITNTGDKLAAQSLVNGDCDGDNSITIFDYVDLSNSFDLSVGDTNYNAAADLDRDGTVTIFDYLILSNNFDKFGAEF
ncbi:MAG: dockerin type I repeat-containing protein [Armatimonadetes bacterium]|nr:dockerin type I repeat-containing protein [Armatimonadota bacterium]